MNWLNVTILTAGILLLLFVLLHVERKRLWVAVVFLILPTSYLLMSWASYRKQWPEMKIAAGVGGALAAGWWLVYGRKLPAPTSDNIKVWGQESAPKPKPQEMQAEIQRLTEEKERLEAELRRMKDGGNGQRKDG